MHALRSSRAFAPVVLAAFVLAGCPKRIASPTGKLEAAARDADSPHADAHTRALGGFHAWLVEGDAKRAKARFDAALKEDPAEPWALYGELLLSRRAAHPERVIDSAFTLCTRAAAHPLCAAAAREVLGQVGTSTALDDRILAGVAQALAQHPPGDAAHLLRSAVATIAGQRVDGAAQTRVLDEMGVPTGWTLAGPFSPFHLIAFDEVTPPERDGALSGPFDGPFGPTPPRVLHFPDGRVGLGGEPSDGDMYVLATDFDVEAPGTFVVRSVTNAPLKAWIDGTPLFERRSFEHARSTVSARAVALDVGAHRLMLKVSNHDAMAGLTVSVMRADGSPAHLRFRPASGPAPKWDGSVPLLDAPATWPDAASYARTLEDEVGTVLASFVAIEDGMGRDADGAERLMAHLAATAPLTPALLSLRARLSMADRELPSRVARARATRDLEAALDRDKGDVDALLMRAQFALDDGRQQEASELVKRAKAAYTPAGFPVPMLRARVELAMGIDAQAERSAEEALSIQPGLCEALNLRYDLARRRDAVALADRWVQAQAGCPGSRTRLAEHARTRGNLPEAIALYEGLLARDPSNLGVIQSLIPLYVAARRFPDAETLLQKTAALWPRDAELLRRLADVQEFAGRPKDALATREKALRLAGGDLALRRSVHRAKTGKELLSEYAIDGAEAIRRYEAKHGTEEAASALVLDMAAVEAFPDGSMVDRIHVIQKALSQEGVSAIAEVNLPAGAAVLSLRTIKPDGTVLEPEDISGKESISLPGVQVGDYVEYEFLQAHSPRGPAQPGFAASIFYYQVAGMPNAWSTYTVIAPKDSQMQVDAHNVTSAPPKLEGDQLVYRHEELNVPPWIPEPNAPPSPNEYLPWVQLGAGARGNEGLVALYADAFLDRGRRTSEVDRLAEEACAGKEGLEKVQAIYAAVMHRLSGPDAGLSVGAADSIAQGRGSRLWALKAALEAAGVPTRIAAVRTFFADPAPYLFPNDDLLPYLALRAELPDGRKVWLDTVVRYGPFGQLPEAASDAEAYLLPEPGRPLEKVRTPPVTGELAKHVTLELTLAEDGTLTGKGEERYRGFDAAVVTESLERLSPDQRKQALQSALSRYFGGAEMSDLQLTLVDDVGKDLVVTYAFRVPGFAHMSGNQMVLGSVTLPAQLGRRYVQLAERTTPLFVDSSEETVAHVTLKLPHGWVLRSAVGEATLKEDFGSFVRREQQKGDTVTIDEDFRLRMMRLPPERYQRFAQFAGQVDLLQTRDLVLEQR
ncbi:MAG: hypothetical protein IRZ16_10450 [Myxococcaceae bacterium]|nr:hypothetical protein [Myxococcaceae bacterium]